VNVGATHHHQLADQYEHEHLIVECNIERQIEHTSPPAPTALLISKGIAKPSEQAG
jgi:hypothetical protein